MRHLTIVNFGTFLGVNGNRLIVKEADGRTWETLLSRLRTIRVAKKGISVSSNLVITCASRGIRLYFVDWQGIAVAAVSGLHNHAVVNVRKAQFKNLQTAIAFDISKEIVRSKIKNQRAVLLYYNKYLSKTDNNLSLQLTSAADKLTRHIDSLKGIGLSSLWRETLMGVEGAAAATYWESLVNAKLLPAGFVKREGRGSKELTNICFNYGYAILQSYCWSALDNAGFELYAGFLHADRPGKPSLVLDFMEEYRAWVVDRNIIKIRNKIAKAKSFDLNLKSTITEMIGECLSGAIVYKRKRIKLENLMQRQAYRLAGSLIGEKSYKGIRFKW